MSNFSKRFNEAISKEINAYIAQKANQIADEVKEIARLSIQDWYNSYHPKYYRRTYATYAGVTRVCIIKDHFAIAGVRIDPSQVPDTYYHDSPGYVFPRTFFQGIHGTIGTGGITTPPAKILAKNFNTYKSFL